MNRSSAVAEMGDRSHNRHGPKEGGGAAVHLSRMAAGSPSNNVACAEFYFRTKWRLHPSIRLATIDMGLLFPCDEFVFASSEDEADAIFVVAGITVDYYIRYFTIAENDLGGSCTMYCSTPDRRFVPLVRSSIPSRKSKLSC